MKKQLQNLMGIAVLTLALSFSLSAQNHYYHHRTGTANRDALAASGQGSNIDVVYHRFEWRIHPDSPSTTAPAKFLKGSVTTYFVTKQPNVSSISFDFNKVHTIDSVKYHGNKLASINIVWNTTKILQLNLPTAITSSDKLDSIAIYYKGTPPAVNGEEYGYQRGGSSTNNYIYTLSESYEDRDWWPCKHDMNDKIDSMDIIVSVPSAFWVAANGKMTDSAIVGANRIFKFKHRYPIASYLVSLGVAKYQSYHRAPVNIGGTNVPIVYNLFANKSRTAVNNALTALDKCRLEIAAFSGRYGDYPFKKEKFGFYEFGYGGGMEHQTFAGMGAGTLTSWSTIAHELAHQWFGNQVTCATWSDLWINEGFARYNEILAAELVTGLGNPVTHRAGIKSSARSVSTTPIFISNISTSNTIWTSANFVASYERGCMVISMLRTLLGDDLFFRACRNYLSDPLLTYKAAATADVQRHFQSLFGQDMSPFFNAWIYGYGNSSYAVSWNTTGNNIKLRLVQSRTTGASVTHFPMPVVLRLSNALGTASTTVVLYDRGDSLYLSGNGLGAGVAGNTISLSLPFAPSTVSFDPNSVTMATGTVTRLTTLREAAPVPVAKLNLYPNPTKDVFTVQQLSSNMLVREDTNQGGTLLVVDMNGQTVLRKNILNGMEKISTANWKPGTYTVELIANGEVIGREKLVVAH